MYKDYLQRVRRVFERVVVLGQLAVLDLLDFLADAIR